MRSADLRQALRLAALARKADRLVAEQELWVERLVDEAKILALGPLRRAGNNGGYFRPATRRFKREIRVGRGVVNKMVHTGKLTYGNKARSFVVPTHDA